MSEIQLNFVKEFDTSVINHLDDKSIEFQDFIKLKVDEIYNVFNIYSGVKTMTTFVDYKDIKFKITVQ
jgi:hypothetical protein